VRRQIAIKNCDTTCLERLAFPGTRRRTTQPAAVQRAQDTIPRWSTNSSGRTMQEAVLLQVGAQGFGIARDIDDALELRALAQRLHCVIVYASKAARNELLCSRKSTQQTHAGRCEEGRCRKTDNEKWTA
jgi:hypothetical protein